MERLIASDFNRYFIFYKQTGRFIKVALLLHLTSLLGLVLFLGFGRLALSALEQNHTFLYFILEYLSIYGVVLIILTQMDAFSRFQNYKLSKDLFFENGFQKRIANLFISSRCQREAIKIAALDLGIADELNAYLDSLGFRWFHVIPKVVISKPEILLARSFWEKTFFVKPYTSKYFLW
ncbi:MAG: hypothetical protein GY737_17890 [Desulfobacteraceae bacterium]|nr:hypothetical protein [Desulfobacteraceae bacterium]